MCVQAEHIDKYHRCLQLESALEAKHTTKMQQVDFQGPLESHCGTNGAKQAAQVYAIVRHCVLVAILGDIDSNYYLPHFMLTGPSTGHSKDNSCIKLNIYCV